MNKLVANHPVGIATALVSGALTSWFSNSLAVILFVVVVSFIVGTALEWVGK